MLSKLCHSTDLITHHNKRSRVRRITFHWLAILIKEIDDKGKQGTPENWYNYCVSTIGIMTLSATILIEVDLISYIQVHFICI